MRFANKKQLIHSCNMITSVEITRENRVEITRENSVEITRAPTVLLTNMSYLLKMECCQKSNLT